MTTFVEQQDMTLARKSPLFIQPTSAERFAAYEPTSDEVELALASSVASALPSASLGLGIMYILLSASHGLLLPADQRNILLPLAALSAIFFLTFYFSGSSSRLGPSSHAMAGLFGIIALLNSGVHLFISADPLQSSNILLVMLAVSAFFLSTRWFTIVITLSIASWAAAAMSTTLNDTWVHFGIALAMGLLTSIIIHRVRVRAYINLHRLRLQHNRQVTQLEDARELLQTRVQEQSEALVSVSGSLSQERLRSEIRESILQEQAADLARKTAHLEERFANQIATLKQENNTLNATVKVRTDTVLGLSDKMRFPIITAQSSLETLNRSLDSKLTPRQAELLGRVTSSLDDVRESAEKLRTVPKLSGKEVSAKTAVAQLVKAISNHIDPKARPKQIGTQFAVEGNVQFVPMETNQLRLALVAMANTLLGRMAANEEIGLLVRGNAAKKHARFIIWSSTHAMPLAEYKKVFEGNDANAKYDLLLAKRLVEKAGGTVALHNGQGRGLAFVIELPWEPSDAERKTAPAKQMQSTRPSIVEILLRKYQL